MQDGFENLIKLGKVYAYKEDVVNVRSPMLGYKPTKEFPEYTYELRVILTNNDNVNIMFRNKEKAYDYREKLLNTLGIGENRYE